MCLRCVSGVSRVWVFCLNNFSRKGLEAGASVSGKVEQGTLTALARTRREPGMDEEQYEEAH